MYGEWDSSALEAVVMTTVEYKQCGKFQAGTEKACCLEGLSSGSCGYIQPRVADEDSDRYAASILALQPSPSNYQPCHYTTAAGFVRPTYGSDKMQQTCVWGKRVVLENPSSKDAR